MKREDVYRAISTERDYQKAQTANPNRPDMIEDFHVGDALTAIRYNLTKAEESWYKGSVPHQDTVDYLRKIAALCVNIGERYGMQDRKY